MKTEKDLPPAKRTTYLKSLSALEMGNHSLVVSLLQPLVLEEPEFFAGRKLLREAQLLRSRGKSGGFLGRSGAGLSLGKSKAQKCIEAADFAGAISAAEKALENDPTSPQANKDLFEAAEALASKEREAVAPVEAEYEAAPEGDAKVEAARKLQSASKKLQAYEAIARFALETIGLDPKNTKAKHELGDYLMGIEEFEEASKVFEEILRKNPLDLEARDRSKEAAARRSMQRGRLDKSSFSDLVKQRQVAAASGEDKVATASESPEDLARQIYEAHEAGSPDREAARKLADLYFNRDDFENALQYYRYLSALANETDPGLLRKISDVEVRQISRTISEKESALEALAPDDPAASGLREELTELRRDKAEHMLDEARKRVERNPTDLQYRFELGEQLVLAAHYKEAVPELQKARSNPNTRTRALNLLGKCYTERGMLDLASKTLETAAAEIPGMDGTKKDITYNLGLVYERMGDKAKYLECMKQIYEVDYGYLDVAERVESSYTTE
ncbi:MAG: hypothetical protein IAE97_03580 [Chthoniobacterales bacterium]|nr:hypothetical protein [Chthoniobacterales bacterium]